MSKMKHLLRKLHIGGGGSSGTVGGGGGGVGFADHHHHHNRPVSDPLPPTSPLNSTLLERTTGTVENSNSNSNSNSTSSNQVDFNFFEEEFQVQLALAISVSDPDAREDHEMAQIKAAEEISLGRSPTESPVAFLSLRYWIYNVVNYDEKVVDGFYDVYGTTSSAVAQGKIPSLVDLQAVSVLDSVNYEVILVNRGADMELRRLEERVYFMSLEYRGLDKGLAMSTLIQRIADLVVDRMGGPVSDANEMLKRWTVRSYELKCSLNSIILPLGCLDIGISRHRALLFKVLADRVHLPCMLVKGSYYTGTDDGAVNLIKIGDQSEFIIDLMGAPGALIPSEVPGGCLQNSGLHINASSAISDPVNDLSWALSNGSNTEAVSSDLARDASVSMQLKWDDRNVVEKNQIERSEYNFGKCFLSPERLDGGSSGNGKESRAKIMQANDVSQYVISAAEDPEFTQKLHAGLVESGTSPPSVLFSDVDFSDLGERKVLEKVQLSNGNMVVDGVQYHADDLSLIPFSGLGFVGDTYDDSRTKTSSVCLAAEKPATKSIASNSLSDVITDGFVVVNSQHKKVIETNNEVAGIIVDSSGMASRISDGPQNCVLFMSSVASPFRVQPNNDLDGKGDDNLEGRLGMVFSDFEKDIACSSQPTACVTHDKSTSPVLGEVAEWEIPWEDLQIGERIGIGSYGEVYRAEWNGTEVAVKKFMNQDISGDALVQFKCEVEIMLRLRHPNVVLFMGAVTRPPNLSILTEFLPRGSLFKLLHRPNIQIDEKRRLKMALDVAKGMNYLHTSHPVIVHRDLKTPNLLVDKNWVVKVCDFGMSRIKHHTFLSSRSTAGTAEWMAPEVLRNEPSNEKSDVYSFGVILWELATLEVPWTGMNSMQVVGAVGFQYRHLKIPEKVDPVVAEIITDCWNFDAQARPSFGQLISRLRCLQRLCVEKPEPLTLQD